MNSNEDWYQSAIFEYKINEITEHFVNKDLIGKGSFSLVYKTKCESLEGIVVAIKEVNIISNDYNSLKTFITELKIYNRINNKRIIQFYGISRNAEKKLYYLVLEYANQGNLREFINEKNRNENDFEWKERVNLATQIAEGLCYLHKLNIAHRDLHTKNILINDGNIKISDFGLSKDLESLKEEFIKGTPEGYINIYANCWQSEPESRPLIDQVHLQLQSISLKPIFEGSNNPISIDTEKEKTPIGIISTPDSPIYDSNLLYGIREKWDNESRQWLRTGPVQIILREFRSKSTIKNLKLHLEFENAICCYGFTQNPETKYADPEKRPTTLELLEELKTFISIPLKKHQFEAANFKRRSQPLGARPNQLSKDNVEIFVESISVIEAYKTCFRFTNKPLQLDFILSEPKNASEKSLYFNDQGLLECQLKRIDL
ncbi:unnamed protein product [Rhizophagus irregularis]|nr:unnamed protein product [Rhizophagus irregularis]